MQGINANPKSQKFSSKTRKKHKKPNEITTNQTKKYQKPISVYVLGRVCVVTHALHMSVRQCSAYTYGCARQRNWLGSLAPRMHIITMFDMHIKCSYGNYFFYLGMALK